MDKFHSDLKKLFITSGGIAVLSICFFGYTFVNSPNQSPISNQIGNASVQNKTDISNLDSSTSEDTTISDMSQGEDVSNDSSASSDEPQPETDSFNDGTQLVGIDIAAGTYESTDPTPSCTYEKLSGQSTSNGKLNLSSNSEKTKKKISITLNLGDTALTTKGCGTWKKVD